MTLGGVRIGQVEVDDVEAMVMSGGDRQLAAGPGARHRQGYQLRGDPLTLT